MAFGGRQTGRTVAAIEGLRSQQRCGFEVLYICASKVQEQSINQLYPDIPTSLMNRDLSSKRCVILWDHYAIEFYMMMKDKEISLLKQELNEVKR